MIPTLPPYETGVYLLMLRNSRLVGAQKVRIGKRTIGERLGKGTRANRSNYQHITEKLSNLERLGYLSIGDTDRTGTLCSVALPHEVPAIQEQITTATPASDRADYYRDSTLRTQLFERDGWRCRYCGEAVTSKTATLDHILPVSKGGKNDPENLATACLMCNSIKSGRSYKEAAPQILAALQVRRAQS